MKVGIAGGSRSGKTTLARALAEAGNCKFISGDDYFLNPETFPIVAGRPDYERIEAVDWKRLEKDIREHDGNLVVESFLLTAHEHIRSLVDISFFVELDEVERTRRRQIQQPNLDISYIIGHIMARHNELVEPSKIYADVILDGTLPVEALREQVNGIVAERLQLQDPVPIVSPLIPVQAGSVDVHNLALSA